MKNTLQLRNATLNEFCQYLAKTHTVEIPAHRLNRTAMGGSLAGFTDWLNEAGMPASIHNGQAILIDGVSIDQPQLRKLRAAYMDALRAWTANPNDAALMEEVRRIKAERDHAHRLSEWYAHVRLAWRADTRGVAFHSPSCTSRRFRN